MKHMLLCAVDFHCASSNFKTDFNLKFIILLLCYQSVYEPGKRHWLKVKKDYLADGAMADSADLVVLGAYFGTGGKGT